MAERRRSWSSGLGLGLAIVLSFGEGEPAELGGRARVVHVASGDRVSLELDGRRVVVSLAGVRAPPVETPHGRTAKRILGNLALNHEVVVAELSGGGGRAEARLFVGRIDLSEYLVESGHVYSLPDHPSLRALEMNARRAGRGLWAGSPRP